MICDSRQEKLEMSRPKSSNVVIESEVARLVTQMCNSTNKSQKQIAHKSGLNDTNIISMLKSGRTKFPLGRVKSFSNAVGTNGEELLLTILKEYFPEAHEIINSRMDDQARGL